MLGFAYSPLSRKTTIAAAFLLVAGGCRAPSGPQTRESGIRLVDRAAQAGIAARFPEPTRRPGTILDTIGHGCAFLDFNGDGNLDVLIAGSPSFLYQGDGRGGFKDVSEPSGIGKVPGNLLGVAVGDADGDGFPDVYLSGYGTGHLLRNLGGKRFVRVDAGLPSQPWGTTAAWADYDRDGRLDLYVGNYVRFDDTVRTLCRSGDVETSCPPGQYDGIPGRLYRNLGGLRFQDVTRSAGLAESPGKTLGAAWNDVDNDGWPDLALANDEVPGALYRNLEGRFTDRGAEAGIAYSNVGRPHAGMGQDWGDFDDDGRQDLAVATFATELKPLYHQGADGLFVDRS
ncbi:MAG: FG-GAP repeat domain-containing protein, partial [Armatimonadota bacterium]